MSLRRRIALIAAAAVAVTVVLALLALYFVEQADLRDRVDDSLRQRADQVAEEFFRRDGGGRAPPPAFGGPGGYTQIVSARGEVVHVGSEGPFIPAGPEAAAVAAGKRESFFENLFIDGAHVRLYTTPLARDRALQVARPLDEVDSHLLTVVALLGVVGAAGVLVAVLLGAMVAKTALVPVRKLERAAERVASTRDLSERIEVSSADELGDLASNFNAMLASLEDSLSAQRQLVADASHELRTPLTSLRANIEVLARAPELAPAERTRILADVSAEIGALTELVRDLVDLARDEDAQTERDDVALDRLVWERVERARRRSPAVTIAADLAPHLVTAVPGSVERAVDNMLENALKWSPAGATVEVRLRDGELTVRDHGPGIDPDDLPRVFDRFYRAPDARRMPGSGLGLAIVRKVAEEHGWSAEAANPPGGGALLRLGLDCDGSS